MLLCYLVHFLYFICFATIKPNLKRALRRKRAKARLTWHLYRKGFVKLTAKDLLRLRTTLSSHHSRDLHHLQLVSAAMSGTPWKCGWCRRIAKASANNCQHCGGSWEDQDTDFVPPERGDRSQSRKKQKSQWNWGSSGQQDPSWQQRPRTPRGNRQQYGKSHGKDGPKGQQQQKGKSAGKGKGKVQQEQQVEGYTAVAETGKGLPPEPPWRPTLQSTQSLPPPAPPPMMPPMDNQAAMTLSKLTAAIKKQPEKYDPEVHAILQGAALAEGLNATDQMYRSVTDLGKAREALDAARLGRSQNHVRWRDFLTTAVARWQEYTADFQKQEKDFMEAIENAKAALTSARERFEICKATLSEDELKEVGDMTADDPMAEKPQEHIVGKSLQEGFETMAANLVTLQSNAVEMVAAEQQAAKRPRLDQGDQFGHGSAPSLPSKPFGGNAMELFAVRSEEKEPPFQQPDKL